MLEGSRGGHVAKKEQLQQGDVSQVREGGKKRKQALGLPLKGLQAGSGSQLTSHLGGWSSH